MAKQLPDWAYDINSCTKCTNPGYQPSCDPIDININVNCCCPTDDGNDGSCCCHQGIFDALNKFFTYNNTPGNTDIPVNIYGINTTGGGAGAALGSGVILDLTIDYVKIPGGNPSNNNNWVSICAVYLIQFANLPVPPETSNIPNFLCSDDNASTEPCCCNSGLKSILENYEGKNTVINIRLNDSNDSTFRGKVVAVCNDVVWVENVGGSSKYSIFPLCIVASIRE